MKRFLCVVLALIITVGCVPCLAAEPDWSTPFGPQAEARLCDTGRGYLAYSFYSSAIYYSEDGAAWTDLSDRSWVKEAAAYTYLGVGGLGHRELEVLWTGSEYMMRQSMLDDPRLTHQRYGDSPRNNFVTFLDEDFQVIGEIGFDGPVTAIRYDGDDGDSGLYWATTASGIETAFTRADWTPAFRDVPAGAWYAPYVDVCVEEGLMQGVGGGKFEPERQLTSAEAMMLAYRLYCLQHGEDPGVTAAPTEWNLLTLTLSNGVEITGYGDDEIGAGPFSYFDGYSDVGCLTADLCYGEGVKDAVEGPATVTVNGETYSGQASFVNVTNGLTFFPEGYSSDPQAEQAAARIKEAFSRGVDPKFWWRDACYTIAQRGWDDVLPIDDFGRFSTFRWEYAQALDRATEELEAVNHIEIIPDIRDEAVLRLYRAGVLNGVDETGRFRPYDTLTRAEAAAMVARVLKPELRLRFRLPGALAQDDLAGLTKLGEVPHGALFSRHLGTGFAAFLTVEGGEEVWTLITKDGRRLTLDGEPQQQSGGLLVLSRDFQYGVLDLDTFEMILPYGPYTYCEVKEDGFHQDGVHIITNDPSKDYPAYLVWDDLDHPTELSYAAHTARDNYHEGLRLAMDVETFLLGYRDARYEFVIPPQWVDAQVFRDGYAAVAVVDGEKHLWGIIDTHGTTVVPPRYAHMENCGQGVFYCSTGDAQSLVFAGSAERLELPLDGYQCPSFQNGYAVVNLENDAGAYYMDLTGAQASPFFDWAGPVDADGDALVGLNGHVYRMELTR